MEKHTINWSEIKNPNEEIPYNHVTLETPLGLVSIEWKGWKENDIYDINFKDMPYIYIQGGYSLDESKQIVIDILKNKLIELFHFLNL